MKRIINIISVILIFIATNNCTAQTHVTDVNADKFVGSWKWGNQINGLTLIMKKENNTQPFKNNPNMLLDSVIGFHKIYKGGVLTEDNTTFSSSNFIDKKQSIIGNTDNDDPSKLRVWMTHKNKGIELEILYIDSTHIKIIDVRNQEGVRFILPGQAPTDWSIDIPNNITLTKQ